jgi:hypothetical protein
MNPISWLAGAYGLQLISRGTADLVRDRRLSRHAPVRITDARAGLVLVRGRVVPEGGKLVDAPLSGTPCVLAQSRIADLEGTIVQRTAGVSFAIDDGTGRARVLPEAGPLALVITQAWRRSVPERELDVRAQAMMRPGYTVSERGRRERSIDLIEWMVFPGDEIFVLGQAQREVDARGADHGFREPPARLTLRGSTRRELVIAGADRPSLRRAAFVDLGKGAAALSAAALGFVVW